MRQTPGDQGVGLLLGVFAPGTRLGLGTLADATLGAPRTLAFHGVVVGVLQHLGPHSVAQLVHLVGQVAPVGAGCHWDQTHAGNHDWILKDCTGFVVFNDPT